MDRQIVGWMDSKIDGQKDRWIERQMDKIDSSMDYGQKDRWIN